MSDFKKYKVRSGDTVESIALKIGIPAKEIRAYHNQNCEIWQLIEFGLRIKTGYVLIPHIDSYLDKKTTEENSIKKVFPGSENNLRCGAVNGLLRKYGTVIQFKENNRLLNKIHFTSQIEFIKKQNEFFIVDFQINQVYINDREPDLVIEQLADKTSKALYPITLALNNKGEIHKILNIEEIQERWARLKPEIIEYYKGGIIEDLIVAFEKNIESASLLKRNFLENPFCKIYFSPIYQNYSSDLSFNTADFETKTHHDVDEFQSSTRKFFVRRKEITLSKGNLNSKFSSEN